MLRLIGSICTMPFVFFGMLLIMNSLLRPSQMDSDPFRQKMTMVVNLTIAITMSIFVAILVWRHI